ncbi:MAG: pyridoxal-phosphate dependent enzyme [Cellvibrionaceae bacterium]|nr:pyridoxal-phosphate dependent enzyme [Cellvibrionaceae bacterium]
MFHQQKLALSAAAVTLQPLVWPALERRGIKAYLRRDDQLSAAYSGNKYYKLYYNLERARRQRCSALVSFGGAYSNHLHALAALGRDTGFTTLGIVRGHRAPVLTPTLQDAERWGMRLLFLDRHHYKNKDLRPILPILKQYGANYYLLPEGGENAAAVQGCQAIGVALAQQLPVDDYTVCCAVATGTTLAGIIAGSPPGVSSVGVSVLKGDDSLTARIRHWLHVFGAGNRDFTLLQGYHHGGYAKVTPELLGFMQAFEADNQLQLDPVYTAKLLWAIERLAEENFWRQGSTLVAIHTGGLQGRRGYADKLDCV